ncbi:hypothetical protein Cde04nite_29880 [Cellulomonas denverensis]|nr:hypothetical protein Cde04nite_29880 [Cellulomonas denverensis]
MSLDLRTAVSLAFFIFAVLVSMVTTGAVVVPARAATSVRERRWRWAPAVALVAACLAMTLLPWWPSKLVCGLAAVLSLIAHWTRPKPGIESPQRARRAAANNDMRSAARLILLAASIVILGLGVFWAFTNTAR